MSEEGPKLYTNKPKKAQIKASSASATSVAPSSGGAAAASYKMGSQSASAPPPPPPTPPKESFLRRHKFLIPLVLGVNLVFGAYLFMRTKKKDAGMDEEVTSSISSSLASSTAVAATPVMEKPAALGGVLEPLKICDPIPENHQREIFKWILEEKRKVKPKDPKEKKRIDEEKAILKQFIRAKSIPNI